MLDAVWVYRVSRPPLGACFKNKVFEFTGPHITIEDIRAQESTIPFLPDEYVAFLMNYNGGLLLDRFYDDECMGFAQLGVSGMYTGWSSSNDKVTPLNLPTVQGLADELY